MNTLSFMEKCDQETFMKENRNLVFRNVLAVNAQQYYSDYLKRL